MADENTSGIDPAFLRTPQNPNARPAPSAYESFLGEKAAAPEPAPAPAPAPQEQPAAPVQVPAQPPVYQANQQEAMLYAQNQQLAQQNQQMAQRMQEYEGMLSEYEKSRNSANIDAKLTNDAFGELDTVDYDDARKISRVVMSDTNDQISALRQDLANIRRDQQKAAHDARVRQTNAEILRVHPDFFELQDTPQYREFMSQRDGFSSETRDARAAREFLNGNSAYVVDVLNQLKGQKPRVADIQSVAPVQAAHATASMSRPSETSGFTLKELNDLYQMRRIDHPQYVKELAKLRAAN